MNAKNPHKRENVEDKYLGINIKRAFMLTFESSFRETVDELIYATVSSRFAQEARIKLERSL